MTISVSEETRAMIIRRQQIKKAAIRPVPIYDAVRQVPVRGTEIRCLEFTPAGAMGALPVVFDLHGGGFTNGYPEEDDLFCRHVSNQLGVRVVSIDYRLAPEYPFPEGLEDAYAVIRYYVTYAVDTGILPSRMAICGHSAGGNLALAVTMLAAERGDFSFRGVVLDYPCLDMMTHPSQKFFTEGCVPVELAELFDSCYALPEQRQNMLCSPCLADDAVLRQLPPTTIVTCEIDSLRDEAEEFGLRLARNGIEVTLRRFLGASHAFTIRPDHPDVPEAFCMMRQSLEHYLKERIEQYV